MLGKDQSVGDLPVMQNRYWAHFNAPFFIFIPIIYFMNGMKIIPIKLFCISAAMLIGFCACSPSPRFTSKDYAPAERGNNPSKALNTISYKNYSNNEILETVIGTASFYADKFNGRLTSNGEIYDMYGLTAAHCWYPHNTILRVTNLSNNKSVIIRINDRMPKHPDRIIDLSLGTAIELDMVEDGLAEVKLEILEWGKE